MIAHLRQAEWVRRFGHYWWVYPAALAATLIPHSLRVGWLVMTPVLAVGIFWMLVASEAHEEQLCPQCIEGWPTNPSEVAELRWRWLWWYHFGPITQLILLVIVLFGLIVIPILPGATGTLFLVGMFYAREKSRRLHNDLQPWCRWCHRDDDDDEDEVEPTPTPNESLR